MDVQYLIGVLQESLYLILVFAVVLAYGMVRGKQSLVNLILALYFALLISLEFPYYEQLLGSVDGERFSNPLVMIGVFAAFAVAAVFLFERLIPADPDEVAFEGFGKKALLAVLASVLVMAYSYHVLPVTEIITPGSPIQLLFSAESNFFWWLLLPAVGLMFL